MLEHNGEHALAWLEACGVKNAETNPQIRFVTSHSFAGNVSARRSDYEDIEVQNRYRNCFAINADRCPVAWDRRLKDCCLDSEVEAGVGNIFNM